MLICFYKNNLPAWSRHLGIEMCLMTCVQLCHFLNRQVNLRDRATRFFTSGFFHKIGYPTFTCLYLREFSKKFEMTQMLFLGAWGKMISVKILKQKVSWQCPFKCKKSTFLYIFLAQMSPFPSCHQIARKDNLWTCFKASVAFLLFIPYSEQK